MSVAFEVWDSSTSSWVNKTNNLTALSRKITPSAEELDGEIVNDTIAMGDKVRLSEGATVVFEGVVYEVGREHKSGDKARYSFRAYTDLILYQRHVVYRLYPAGQKAGEIIKDLAALESGVDVTNVADGDALLNTWTIENQPALDVMQSIARALNYWLRMKPGKKLYFQPKTIGASKGTINASLVREVSYGEDRWRLKNRVIYVGAGGAVLADVSEAPGDMPLVVNDPFLTDRNEARRRANIRLSLNKEYGRELEIEMSKTDYDGLAPDIGDTFTINLPSVGLNNVNMTLLEISYDFSGSARRLRFGGRLELLEDWMQERIGGDVAARFGQKMARPELTSAVSFAIEAAAKIQADARTIRLYHEAPIVYENGQNVILNSDGEVELVAGATSGSFEVSALPTSALFSRWLRVHYEYDTGGGSVSATLHRGSETIQSNIPQDYEIPYIPPVVGEIDEQNASEWAATKGALSDAQLAVISYWSVRYDGGDGSFDYVSFDSGSFNANGAAYYPATRDLGWDTGRAKYLVIYLFSFVDDPYIKIRLHSSNNDYFEANINHTAGTWQKYIIDIDTMTQQGAPNRNSINYISVVPNYAPSVFIDTDWLLQPALRERLTLRFTLSRPKPTDASPVVKLIKFVWREG